MKCARLIFAIVSTTNIPNSLPQIFEGASVQNYRGGHFWTPITPIMGSTLHAYPQADRLKRRLPWFATGAVVLALVLTFALPRFYASNAAACAVLGAEWTQTTAGARACVFYLD